MSDFWTDPLLETANFGLGVYDRFYRKSIDDLNYSNLIDQKNYERWLQTHLEEREDSAVTRHVNDLINAGLSPYLATGAGAGAGQEVSRTTPQRQGAGDTPKFKVSGEVAGLITDLKLKEEQLKQAREQTQILKYESIMKGVQASDEQIKNRNLKLENEITFLSQQISNAKADADVKEISFLQHKTELLRAIKDDMSHIRSLAGESGSGHWIQQAIDAVINRAVNAANYNEVEVLLKEYLEILNKATRKD